MSSPNKFLTDITKKAAHDFQKSRAVLSFEQYIEEVTNNPDVHIRNCAKYFLDMVDSFGAYEIKTPAESLRRYRIFDADFLDGEGRIYGQERVQHQLIAHVKNFVRSGRVDKLLLLHGPNGSSKTSLVQAISRALENYCKSDAGALYKFSWVFPRKDFLTSPLGFNGEQAERSDSFAFLTNEGVDASLPSELRDHPLLLLSLEQRQDLFSTIGQDLEKRGAALSIPEILSSGELSQNNRQIFDTLLSSYNGDLSQVFRHVRVERFYLSRRYKRGISVVEPQLSVDADVRQMTSDQSILSLPGSLRHLSLFSALGPLVEANRGLIEYSDLLKRPVEAWKYLLVACEQAQVSVGSLSLFFDLLMIATSNELHLNSFREYPDWPSFKGRIELIRVPYLLRSVEEEGIYFNQMPKALSGLHIAPHSIAMAARWATLTRLEPPDPEKYPASIKEVISMLTPEDKLALYNDAEVPSWLSQSQARKLKASIPALFNEYFNHINYEGRFGASPREVRLMILNASQDPRFDHLSVEAIFYQIESLMEQVSTYDFLRRESVRGFRDARYLLESVKGYYRRVLEDEVRNVLGLYRNESYQDLFTRYIGHVSAWTKKERLFDPVIKKQVEADGQFMKNVEQSLLAKNESSEDFRRQLISEVAAFKLENPESNLEYELLFSSHIKRLKEEAYKEQSHVVERILRASLQILDGDSGSLEERDVNQAEALKEGLFAAGYNLSSARWAIVFLLKEDTVLDRDQQLGLKIDKYQ